MADIDLIKAHELHQQHQLERRTATATLRRYGGAEQDFLDFLRGRGIAPELKALNVDNLEQFERWLRPRRRSGSGPDALRATAMRLLILQAWCRFLVDKGFLRVNPLRDVRLVGNNILQRATEIDSGLARRRAAEATKLGRAIDDCLLAMRAEGKSPDTVRTYAIGLRLLLVYACAHSCTTPAQLTPAIVRGVMAERMAGGTQVHAMFKGGEAAAKSVLHAAIYLYRFCRSQGLDVPDISGIKRPRVPERVQPRVSGEEFRALEHAVVQRLVAGDDRRLSRIGVARDLALLALLGDTGLRAGEVCSMNVDDIDFEAGAITVRRGKGGNGRALSIVDSAADAVDGGPTLQALRNYLEHRARLRRVDAQALWVSLKGTRLARQELQKILGRLCRDAGLSGSRPPHAFRRANFTENYLADPAAIKVLAARMGWSDKSHHMISTYTRGADVDLARTTPRPSLSRSWRDGSPAAGPSPAAPPPARGRASNGANAKLSAELVAAVQNNPKLVRMLLDALAGVA